jgi:hypothetical protein
VALAWVLFALALLWLLRMVDTLALAWFIEIVWMRHFEALVIALASTFALAVVVTAYAVYRRMWH